MTRAFQEALTATVLISFVAIASAMAQPSCPCGSSDCVLNAVVTTDLGTLGGTQSSASAVNAGGKVVGLSTTATSGGNRVAFSWMPGGPPTPPLIPLGTLGGPNSAAQAVNFTGQIAGSADISNQVSHAALWTQVGTIVDLGSLGGDHASAVALNDSGAVVGNSEITPGDGQHLHAFFWQAGSITDLGDLGGNFTQVRAVNALGLAVGTSTRNDGTREAFLWTRDTTPGINLSRLGFIDICDPAVCIPRSEALSVNFSGQIVGQSTTKDSTNTKPVLHAFLWPVRGRMADLDALSNVTTNDGIAAALNDSGQVVGSNDTPDGRHAFLWTEGGGMTDLGTLAGFTSSEAVAVNASGQVIGNIHRSDGASHAFWWTPMFKMIDLGTLGGRNSRALAINAGGKIVGDSDTAPDPRTGVVSTHAALWSPQCRELSCGERCDRDDSMCQDSCIADFESCPAETPHQDCVKALKACLKDCSNKHVQCLASCR